jgi:hypothetical protein
MEDARRGSDARMSTWTRIGITAAVGGVAAAVTMACMMAIGASRGAMQSAPAIVAVLAAMSVGRYLRDRDALAAKQAKAAEDDAAQPAEPRLGAKCPVCDEAVVTLDRATACDDCGETLHRACADRHDCTAA